MRDVYPDSTFNGFGLAGIENIMKLFCGIIRLVCVQKDNLLPRKYGKREIVGLANMSSVQELLPKFEKGVIYEDVSNRCYIEFDNIRVYIWFPEDGKLSQFSLCNIPDGNEGKRINTGIYLSPTSLLKLFRYLNTRFTLMDSEIPQAKCIGINQYDRDDFF